MTTERIPVALDEREPDYGYYGLHRDDILTLVECIDSHITTMNSVLMFSDTAGVKIHTRTLQRLRRRLMEGCP